MGVIKKYIIKNKKLLYGGYALHILLSKFDCCIYDTNEYYDIEFYWWNV